MWGVGAEDGESRGTSHSREGRAGLPARPPQTAPRKARGGPRHTDGETARRHTSHPRKTAQGMGGNLRGERCGSTTGADTSGCPEPRAWGGARNVS